MRIDSRTIIKYLLNLLVLDLGFQCLRRTTVYLVSGKPLNGAAVTGLLIGASIMCFGVHEVWRLRLKAGGRDRY